MSRAGVNTGSNNVQFEAQTTVSAGCVFEPHASRLIKKELDLAIPLSYGRMKCGQV